MPSVPSAQEMADEVAALESAASEEAFKSAVLQDIAALINLTTSRLGPGAFERAEIYARAGALIERGPKQSQADISASVVPIFRDLIGNFMKDSGPGSKQRLFDELHQLVHTREIVNPGDKESLKLIDSRIAEIRRELGPEHASVVSIVPPAEEAEPDDTSSL